MASNLEVDSISKGVTTVNTDEIVDTSSNQICKAWVNFNGTGTVAIRDSYNVSSITDNGTGDFSANFTTAMPNANYSATTSCRVQSGIHHSVAGIRDILSGSCRVTAIHNTSNVAQDKDIHTLMVFGD